MTTPIKRKSLKYYLGLHYPVTFEASSEGGYFVEIKDLPGCYAQGKTMDEAQEMIDIARKMWLEVAYEDGNEIPLPRNEEDYSGKFNVRFPKSLHKKLDGLAVREGVSLNQYLVSTLSHAVGFEEGRKAKTRSKRRKL
jgi:antitoxin HicB